MKNYLSDTTRNPSINPRQGFPNHNAPQALDPAKTQAALNRRADLVSRTNASLKPFSEQAHEALKHDEWLGYVNRRLLELSENC